MNRNIRLATTLLAVLALVGLAGSAVMAGDQHEEKADITLAVSGMTCGGCTMKVETAVKELKGVVDAKADYEAGSATVTYVKGEVTVDRIVATINEKTTFKASVPKPQA